MSLRFKCSNCGKELEVSDIPDHNCLIATPIVVPDMIGEVMGWRAWKIVGEGDSVRLGSVTHTGYCWKPKQKYHIAECGIHGTEEIPFENHTCGFYAAKTREHLLSMSYHRYNEVDDVVIGEVAMSGKIIPGTQGWRAQKARIEKIYVPFERWKLFRAIEEVYDVKVELANTLKGSVEDASPF